MRKLSKEIKRYIHSPIPEYLIRQRPGGGNRKLNYISGSTVIDMLNYAFDYMWDWRVENEWIQESQPQFNPKYDKEPKKVNSVAHVRGVLTIYMEQKDGKVFTISKTGYGSKAIIGGQSEQESIFKAAGTDALKKAASMIGIGASLYRDEGESYYFNELINEEQWTEISKTKKSDQLKYVAKYRSDNEVDDEEMVNIIKEFSDNKLSKLADIIPTNIDDFVKYLKNREES